MPLHVWLPALVFLLGAVGRNVAPLLRGTGRAGPGPLLAGSGCALVAVVVPVAVLLWLLGLFLPDTLVLAAGVTLAAAYAVGAVIRGVSSRAP